MKAKRPIATLGLAALLTFGVDGGSALFAQPDGLRDALVAALKPALPFPSADDTGELPARGAAEPRWFVVWPADDETRVHVKANPLHGDVQAAGAQAMARIQRVVEEAERQAQAAYERAVEEVKRTGKDVDVSGVTLGDEGVEGARIDAELELMIDADAPATADDVIAAEPPAVSALTAIGAWIVRAPAHTYRDESARERFAAAETRLYFGTKSRPVVTRRAADRFSVELAAGGRTVSVRLRGNAKLQHEVVAAADWGIVARWNP
jgi:hypothetical protein